MNRTQIVYYGPGVSGRSTNILYLASLLPASTLSSRTAEVLEFPENARTWLTQFGIPEKILRVIDNLRSQQFFTQEELLVVLQRHLSPEMLQPYWGKIVQASHIPGRIHQLTITAQAFSALDLDGRQRCVWPLELCVFSSNIAYNPGRKHLLEHAAGSVVVMDSQQSRLHQNIRVLEEFANDLHQYGTSLEQFPWVMQYNKRDLEHILPVDELEAQLNPAHVPAIEAVASQGIGVVDTLAAVLQVIEQQTPPFGNP